MPPNLDACPRSHFISLQNNSFLQLQFRFRHSTRLPGPSLLPDGIVGRAEVDEEIPAPVPHGQQVGHAAEVHGQQTGPAPDGGHAPGCYPHIGIKRSQGLHLPVQVVGALKGQKQGNGLQLCYTFMNCGNLLSVHQGAV